MIRSESNFEYFLSRTTLANVGIVCTPEAKSICMKNNLNIVELLRPFAKVSEKIRIKNKEDPGLSVDISEFEVNLIDLDVENVPPDFCAKTADAAVKFAHAFPAENEKFEGFFDLNKDFQYWYHIYIDLLSQMVIPLDFDFLRRILGVIIVVSSSDTDIMKSYQKCNDRIDSLINSEAVCLNPYLKFGAKNIYRYVVLVHDGSVAKTEKFERDVALLKQVFFTGYFILTINNIPNSGFSFDFSQTLDSLPPHNIPPGQPPLVNPSYNNPHNSNLSNYSQYAQIPPSPHLNQPHKNPVLANLSSNVVQKSDSSTYSSYAQIPPPPHFNQQHNNPPLNNQSQNNSGNPDFSDYNTYAQIPPPPHGNQSHNNPSLNNHSYNNSQNSNFSNTNAYAENPPPPHNNPPLTNPYPNNDNSTFSDYNTYAQKPHPPHLGQPQNPPLFNNPQQNNTQNFPQNHIYDPTNTNLHKNQNNFYNTTQSNLSQKNYSQKVNKPIITYHSNPWIYNKFPSVIFDDSFALSSLDIPIDEVSRFFHSPSLCAFLREKINKDLIPTIIDPCGQFLGIEDQNNIQFLMIDFIVNGLIPHLATTIQDISSVIEYKKPNKSVWDNTKSFFSDKLSNKSGAVPTLMAIKLRAYPESWQLLTKKLADFLFILKNYESADKKYRIASKSYDGDGKITVKNMCLEMLNLISIIKRSEPYIIYENFIECIKVYVSSRYLDYGLRASFVFAEYLFEQKYNVEALNVLSQNINHSGNLKKALIFDRMAHYCSKNGLRRFAAFRCLISGIYYSQIDQVNHSLRCVHNCRTLIGNKRYFKTIDYLNEFILTRCTKNNYLPEAVDSASKLLLHQAQSAEKQIEQLELFLGMMKIFIMSPSCSLQEFPDPINRFLPFVNIGFISIDYRFINAEFSERKILRADHHNMEHLTSEINCKCSPKEINSRLEDIQNSIFHALPTEISFNLDPKYVNYANYNQAIPCFLNESVSLTIPVYNTLKICFRLVEITLMWIFKNNDGTIIHSFDNNAKDYIESSTIQNHSLEPCCYHPLVFVLHLKKIGKLEIIGINFTSSSEDKLETLEKSVCIFSNLKYQRSSIDFIIKNENPLTQIKFNQIPQYIIQNLRSKIHFHTSNYNNEYDLYIWSSVDKNCFIFQDSETESINLNKISLESEIWGSNNTSNEKFSCFSKIETQNQSLRNFDFSITLDCKIAKYIKLEILVLLISKSGFFKIFNKHFHLNVLKGFEFQIERNYLTITDVEKALDNNLTYPPLKYSIHPKSNSDSVIINHFKHQTMAYTPMDNFNILNICNDDSTITNYWITVGKVHKSKNEILYFCREIDHPHVKILIESISKQSHHNCLYLVLFYKISIRLQNCDIMNDGLSIIKININDEYFVPTLFSQILPLETEITQCPMIFPFSLRVEFYFDASFTNEISMFHIGVGIWNLSDHSFSLDVEAVSSDVESQQAIIFVGDLKKTILLKPKCKPSEILRFEAISFDNVEIDSSCFQFTLNLNGRNLHYIVTSISKIAADDCLDFN